MRVPPRLDDSPLPLRPVEDPPRASKPTPAPAWVALATAWLGLIMLIASVAFIFLPGSQSPREELENLREYSLADRFLPLPDALVAQRVQAWVGIVLALVATVVIYTWVGFRGPR